MEPGRASEARGDAVRDSGGDRAESVRCPRWDAPGPIQIGVRWLSSRGRRRSSERVSSGTTEDLRRAERGGQRVDGSTATRPGAGRSKRGGGGNRTSTRKDQAGAPGAPTRSREWPAARPSSCSLPGQRGRRVRGGVPALLGGVQQVRERVLAECRRGDEFGRGDQVGCRGPARGRWGDPPGPRRCRRGGGPGRRGGQPCRGCPAGVPAGPRSGSGLRSRSPPPSRRQPRHRRVSSSLRLT